MKNKKTVLPLDLENVQNRREYHIQLCAEKWGNRDEMDCFLGSHSVSKFIGDEAGYLKGPKKSVEESYKN